VSGGGNGEEGGADYGVDAPRAVRNAVLAGSACGLLAPLAYALLRPRRQGLARRGLALGACAWLSSLALVGGMLWSSTIGKLRPHDRLLDAIPWRGDETVLDVGCGRGLLLIAAAKRLTEGKAIGVDVWDASDQSGNSPQATLENARIEGVFGRVEVLDGDARPGCRSETGPSTWWSRASCYTASTPGPNARGPCGGWCACSRAAGTSPSWTYCTPAGTSVYWGRGVPCLASSEPSHASCSSSPAGW
jgi:Ribosomal protein L11 methyltransferase (PrmA)